MAPAFSVEGVGQRVSKKLLKDSSGRVDNGGGQKMGKSRNVVRNVATGFVRDYRYASEPMGDSEGHGSSGRVDREVISSNNISSNNLNGNVCGEFGVPVRVLAVSEMTSFERRELVARLKRELEEVSVFRRNVEERFLRCSGGGGIPSHLQSIKKRVLSENVNDGLKKAVFPPTTGNAMLMKQCDTLLKCLMRHKFGGVFNVKVDPVALNIPDYNAIIKHPMDLGTIKAKLNSGKYVEDLWGFAGDVRLTFTNAMTYNPRGHDVYVMAETLSKVFEGKWKPIEKKLSVAAESYVPMRRNALRTEPETPTVMPPLKKQKMASFENERKYEPVKKVMSVAEKVRLSSELESLLADLPESVIEFLKENSPNANATDDEIEIDIDDLSDETLFKLRKLIDDLMVDKQKKAVTAETCEIEIHNDSGPSNSSMQAVKVNDVNEDVDIGDDVPVTSFPPLVIEKDTAAKSGECSSSSSSSSDSGSSSSDSDSESDDANISATVNKIKDTLHPEANLEQTVAVLRDTEDSVDKVLQVEQKPQSAPVSGEVDGRQEGVGAPIERQMSSDKLYRAALLKGRFADTILKAQEKTTGKVEKQDMERLRLEKEELEKRRKQEKARLQAEAKAAEEAKRKAELKAAAEAAVEAKRKRELDREAARQALQKMEKMVDINDNSGFLEDLEMLSGVPTEPLHNLIDENSSSCFQDPLGSFNMNRKGNPLEQLGLYMKNDDDDEEDGGVLRMEHDSEEGEID